MLADQARWSLGRGNTPVPSPWQATHPPADTIDITVGYGSSWADALTDIAWTDDEILVIGTSSSPIGRLFLGSHAAKIVRNSPVPVMLVPRSVVNRPSESD